MRRGFVRRGLIALAIVMLSGCARQVKTVYVPVSSCPAPPDMFMPVLQVEQLPKKPETAAALKALLADHIQLKGSLEQCLVVLKGYKPASTTVMP